MSVYIGFLDPAANKDYFAAIVLKVHQQTLRLAGLKLIDNTQEGNRDIKHRFYRTVIPYLDKWMKSFKQDLVLGIDASTEQLLVERFEYLGYKIEPIKFSQPLKQQMMDNLIMMMQDHLLDMPDPRAIKDVQLASWVSELALQCKEQERIARETGRVSFSHPPGKHDDFFSALMGAAWLGRPYVYEATSPPVFVSMSSRGIISDYAYVEEDFPELEKSGAEITSVSRHDPA